MKTKMTLLTSAVLLFSANSFAIPTVTQLFFSDTTSGDICGPSSRLITVSELEEMKRTNNLCNDVDSTHAIWKVQGDDNTLWSFMGRRYNCQTKPGVDPLAQSICIAKEEAPKDTASLFPRANYSGITNWKGIPTVATVGSENPSTNIQSFKLADGLTLIGYTEENYSGEEVKFTTSQANLEQEIKSFKLLEATTSDNIIKYSYSSETNYKSCIKLHVPGTVVKEICNDQTGAEFDLVEIADKAYTINVATYEYRFEDPTVPTSTVGQFFINFDGEGDFSVTSALQEGVELQTEGNLLKFTSKK